MNLKISRSLLACLIVTSIVLNACNSKQNQPLTDLTPLPSSEDYIFYLDFETNTDYIWAINPNGLTPIFVTSELALRSWSPSNNYWLLTGNHSIYIANADGSDIRNVYTYNTKYEGIEPFWLTNDVVLFNAYKDYFFSPPDMYSLEINTGAVNQLFPGSNKFIQAAFPSEKKWLLANWSSGPLDIVDQGGGTAKFFDDFLIVTHPNTQHPPIERIKTLDRYLIAAKEMGDTEYKLWLVSNYENPKMLFDPGNDGLNYYLVSPNEQYLALTYVGSNGTYLYIFNLGNQQLTYQWPCPYKIGACNFFWSPDSQSIVLHYSESDVGSSTQVNSGIQVMNIETGETKIILREDIELILDWHFIGK